MSADGLFTLGMRKVWAPREGLLDVKDRTHGLNPLRCGCKLAINGRTIAEAD